MLGDIEMQNFATTMFQDEKDEQYLQGDGRHSEEIQGHRLAKMVAQKGLPRLVGRSAKPSQDPGHGAFRDRNGQHLEFTVNPRRAPRPSVRSGAADVAR